MLKLWLSNHRLLSNSTRRFLPEDEDVEERRRRFGRKKEQPSSVRECSLRLHSISFVNWYILLVRLQINKELSIISITVNQQLTPCFLIISPKGGMYRVKSKGPSTEPWVLHNEPVIDMIPLNLLLQTDYS